MRSFYIFLILQAARSQNEYPDLLKGYVTPQKGPDGRPFPLFNVSEECLEAGKAYIEGLGTYGNLPNPSPNGPFRDSSIAKFDASAFFPPSGVLSDSNAIHFPGSFSGCLNVEDDGFNDEPRDPSLDGRYALLTIIDWATVLEATKNSNEKSLPEALAKMEEGLMGQQPLFLPERRTLEALARSQGNSAAERLKPWIVPFLQKVGKCVPKACSKADVTSGAINHLSTISLQEGANPSKPEDFRYAAVLDTHTKDEEMEFSTADIVMITVVALFVFVIALSTWLDVGITVLDLPYIPKTCLPYFQGFSAYHNIIKICKVDSGPSDGSNLSCINGLKYISITWIVLGHTLAEYTGVLSRFGIFSSSVYAHQVQSTGFAFVAVWNGLLGVDTFLVIGGCLLAFHTLKELDKAKGGSIRMWAMFYVHRYIRLTGVYAIIIGLHATLLKYFATGPQSYQVMSQVTKCQNGWWLNLVYLNNFGKDITGKTGYDCVNVSWYMAIDMQYFVLSPILLTIYWRKPIAGHLTTLLLLAGGTACQIYFTIVDEEYFHGGYGYYVKPWNRAQPYLIGIVLGYILHKMRKTPTLNLNPVAILWIWLGVAGMAIATLYGVANYNLLENINVALPCDQQDEPCQQAPTAVRVIYNGFAKIAWGLSVAWVILACTKGKGGVVDSILSWSAWVPLARVQYLVYLLHRTIIYIINSWAEDTVRYSHTVFATQFIAILGTATFAAFVFVILFEAPIVQLEKLLFGSLGLGRMPQKRKD